MFDSSFFSRTATAAIGTLLLAVLAWTAWMLGPIAMHRWFG